MTIKSRNIRSCGLLLAATALTAPFIATPPAANATQSDLRFDFGGPTSPVADGWTQIATGTAYSASLGYGFLSGGTSFRDRTGSNSMERDFINGAWQFAVDLPNGTYEVTTWSGDLSAGNTTDLTVEGIAYNSRSATGAVAEKTTTVQVADGQLNITGARDGRINGMVIRPPVGVPTSLTSVVDTAERPSVSLSWAAVPGATKYEVYRSTETTQMERVSETTDPRYIDENVEVGDSYGYSVRAFAGDRQSEASNTLEVSVTNPDVQVPGAPNGLSLASIAEREVALTWNDAEDAQRWRIYRSTRADIPFSLVATTTEPKWTDTDVLTTRPYLYRVVALNEGGQSAPSETLTTTIATTLVRNAEYLDRAPVGVVIDGGVYVGWRFLGLDEPALGFNVYRDGVRVTQESITGATNLIDPEGTLASRYIVTANIEGQEFSVTDEFQPRDNQYLDIPIERPASGVYPSGETYSYVPGDSSVGDLDGDGQYEIVMSWNPSHFRDNSVAGYTGNQYLDAYKLDGTRLWRMDLGPNIRAGAHYTQFQVFDFNSDGRAEVSFKTTDGVVDGTGQVIGDPAADHRSSTGYILQGPEWLTVFDGKTGAALDTAEFIPQRGDVAAWGDTYGNRVDRFLAATAYLDGVHPSLIMSRGYYTRTVIAAWDFVDGKLQERWVFDSDVAGKEYEGQGNHNLAAADVDRDGLDEIVFGAMTIDDDGTVLYNTNLLHGDSLHVADHDPAHPGLEVFSALEKPGSNGGIGAAMRDAETGEILWTTPAAQDVGRGAAGDIDPNHPGNESWSVGGDYSYNSPTGTMKNAAGDVIADEIPPALMLGWWDGDLLREIPDLVDFNTSTQIGTPVIRKWNTATNSTDVILQDDALASVNGTKSTPMISADLLGDWREEMVWPLKDYSAMRLYTTVDVTDTRLVTLMHDSQYRTGVAWQNTSYNQPPWPSYFLGTGMATSPQPSINYVGENPRPNEPFNPEPTFTPENPSNTKFDKANELDLGLDAKTFPRGSSLVTLENLERDEWFYVYLNGTGLGWHRALDDGSIQVTTPEDTRPGQNRIVLFDDEGTLLGWESLKVTGPPATPAK